MQYLSAREAAERWGISLRYTQRLLSEGRIPGAKKYQRSWMIPVDAEKPEDLRKVKKDDVRQHFSYLPYRTPIPLMTGLYVVPGSADAVIRKLKDQPELALLCDCQLSYFRGEIQKAYQKAGTLYATASCFDTKIGTSVILSSCAMYLGDVTLWKAAEENMRRMVCGTTADQNYLAMCRAGMQSAIYDGAHFPAWFRRGSFGDLPGETYPLARFYYLKYLLIEKNALRARQDFTAAAEPLISQTKLEGVLLSEAYQRILAAIAYHDNGDDKTALLHIDRVLEITLPDRLYVVLAEYCRQLDFLLFRRLRKTDRSAYDAVISLSKRLLEGWTNVHNAVLHRNVTNVWTIREREVVKLAVYGLTNKEIADRLHLSVNTVKQRLGSAMEKVGVGKRKNLADFL
ncbi:MAG: LuxR C-terminal-related transcriptional regulator [Clostridia bacterium]